MKPEKRLGIILLLLLVKSVITNCQVKRNYYNFSKIDNFSEINVRGFVQDKEGFIYSATGSGLYVHHGNQWKHLKSPIDNTEHSIGTYLNFFKYDSVENEIYLFSLNDFQIFNAHTYTFRRVKCDEKFYKSVKYDCIFEKNYGALISSSEGIFQLKNEELLTSFNISESWALKSNTGTNFVYIDESSIGIINEERLNIFNIRTNIYVKYETPVSIPIRKGILDKKNKRIYFQSALPLWYFDLSDYKYHILPNSKNIYECRDLLLSHDDKLWISSGAYYDLKSNHWHVIPYQEGKHNNAVQYWPSLFEDKEKNIWCGSLGFGSNVQFYSSQKVYNLPHNKDQFYEPLSNLVIKDKLYVTNSYNGYLTSIDLINLKIETFGSKKISLLLNLVNNEKHQRIFCSDFQNIYEVDTKSKNLSTIFTLNKNSKIDIHFLQSIDDLLIFGDNEKIYTYDFIKKELLEHLMKGNDIGVFHKAVIDKNRGLLYLTGNKSVAMFDLVKKVFIKASENTLLSQLQKIPSTYEIAVAKDKLWITSLTNGLFLCDLKNANLKNYNKESHLLTSNFLNHIVVLDDFLYLGTLESLNVFDTKKEKVIQKLDRQSGFNRDDTTYDLYADEKYIIKFNFGNIDILNKNEYDNINYYGDLYFNEINIDHIPKLSIPIKNDTSFVFSETESNIEIEFGINVYDNFNYHNFDYRLLGFDTSWVSTFDRKVNFNNLEPGEYTFEVKGTLFNGDSLPHSRKLHLKIKPLFYKTAWFIALCIFGISAILFTFYRTKLAKVKSEMKLKNKYEKQISELEMKALRAQMNPHFIFNSLNSIQRFIFEKDEYAASQYLTKFSRLIRLILDQSNQDVISISNEIEMLRYYIEMELLRFSNKFTYELKKDERINEETMIPSMVIQPHIENAIWHGLMHKEGDCKLKVDFQYMDESAMKIIIYDNGIGRKSAAELKSKQVLKKKSYGSKISEDRINNFNKLHNINTNLRTLDLEDEHGNATGTQVELTVAIYKN